VRVVRSLHGASVRRPICLAIGVFDGVHLGHQAIISAGLKMAAERSAVPAVLTFEPHPDFVLSRRGVPPLLTTTEEKLELMSKLGVRLAVVADFDRGLAATPAEEFVREILIGQLRAACVVVGEGWRFGAGGRGSPTLLRELGRSAGFGVGVVPRVRVDGMPVSSTAVRRLLALGRVAAAAAYLGRHYRLVSEVVPGDSRGRKIGYPTANLNVPAEKLIPAGGVYACWAGVRRRRPAVASIGVRPTFEAEGDPRVEVHLLDRTRPPGLLGRRLRVEFVARLRAERRFPSPGALARQIERDCARARRVLVPLQASRDVL
jgi:riboflavin kinase/FMN adenylyltransferase